jgi:hypothetical protein
MNSPGPQRHSAAVDGQAVDRGAAVEGEAEEEFSAAVRDIDMLIPPVRG